MYTISPKLINGYHCQALRLIKHLSSWIGLDQNIRET